MRTCTICSHPERAAIEAAVARGESYRSVAQRTEGASQHAIGRHYRNGHVTSIALAPVVEVLEADGVLAEMSALRERARFIEIAAVKEGRLSVALTAIREQSRIISNLIKLAALLKPSDMPSSRSYIEVHSEEQWR